MSAIEACSDVDAFTKTSRFGKLPLGHAVIRESSASTLLFVDRLERSPLVHCSTPSTSDNRTALVASHGGYEIAITDTRGPCPVQRLSSARSSPGVRPPRAGDWESLCSRATAAF
jgi:hypothetical protein